MTCRDQKRRPLSQAKPRQRGNQLTVTHKLGRTFPHRLVCYLGPEEILPE